MCEIYTKTASREWATARRRQAKCTAQASKLDDFRKRKQFQTASTQVRICFFHPRHPSSSWVLRIRNSQGSFYRSRKARARLALPKTRTSIRKRPRTSGEITNKPVKIKRICRFSDRTRSRSQSCVFSVRLRNSLWSARSNSQRDSCSQECTSTKITLLWRTCRFLHALTKWVLRDWASLKPSQKLNRFRKYWRWN